MRQLESWQCSRTSRKFSQASNLQGTQRFPEHCTIPSPNIFSILFGMSETYHQDTSLLEWVEMGQLAISLVTANLRKQALEPDCQGSKLGPATGTLWLRPLDLTSWSLRVLIVQGCWEDWTVRMWALGLTWRLPHTGTWWHFAKWKGRKRAAVLSL